MEKTAVEKVVVAGIKETGLRVIQKMRGQLSDAVRFAGIDREEQSPEIFDALDGAGIMIAVLELAGGGTDIALQLADAAKKRGIFTVAIAAEPLYFVDDIFSGEDDCLDVAEKDVNRIKEYVDSITIITSDNMWDTLDRDNEIKEHLEKTDKVMCRMVQGLISIVIRGNVAAGLNVKGIRNVMGESMSYIGVGEGRGENKAKDAVRYAMESPCNRPHVYDAVRGLLYVEGDIEPADMDDIQKYIKERTSEEIELICGANIIKTDSCIVTLIAAIPKVKWMWITGQKGQNFWRETLTCLSDNGKSEEDVLWVGRGFGETPCGRQYKTTWEDFKSKAGFYYDPGYGSTKIPEDLVIVGKDFWLERNSYDGSEWWAFKEIPKEPAVTKELKMGDDDWLFGEMLKRVRPFIRAD